MTPNSNDSGITWEIAQAGKNAGQRIRVCSVCAPKQRTNRNDRGCINLVCRYARVVFGILLFLVIFMIVPVNQYLREVRCQRCGEFRAVSLVDKGRLCVLDPGRCEKIDS